MFDSFLRGLMDDRNDSSPIWLLPLLIVLSLAIVACFRCCRQTK